MPRTAPWIHLLERCWVPDARASLTAWLSMIHVDPIPSDYQWLSFKSSPLHQRASAEQGVHRVLLWYRAWRKRRPAVSAEVPLGQDETIAQKRLLAQRFAKRTEEFGSILKHMYHHVSSCIMFACWWRFCMFCCIDFQTQRGYRRMPQESKCNLQLYRFN